MSFLSAVLRVSRGVWTSLVVIGVLISAVQAKDKETARGTADTVTGTFAATEDSFDLKSHPFNTSLDWNANDPLFQLAHAHADKCDLNDPNRTYIFHIANWQNTPSNYAMTSSTWYVYKLKGKTLVESHFKANGDPELYGVKRALIVGINSFGTSCGALKITYKTTVKQGTPENVQALGQLASSVVGLSTAKFKPPSGSCKMLVAAGCQEGTQRLPFDLTVAFSASADVQTPEKPTNTPAEPEPGDPTKNPGTASRSNWHYRSSPSYDHYSVAAGDHVAAVALRPRLIGLVMAGSPDAGIGNRNTQGTGGTKPATNGSTQQPPDSSNKQQTPGTADCSDVENKKPCNFVRTFTSDDKEWWDVGIGVAVPGVKESKYSISNKALKRSTTTHTDLYAIFDIYPFAKWVSKETKLPHLTAGLPVTGQTFYRPYFGVAENFTTWTKLEKLGFPVRMGFFAGVVYMKTNYVHGSPTTADELSSALKPERVLKPMLGVEVPVGALINKIGKKSSQNNNGPNTKQAQPSGTGGS